MLPVVGRFCSICPETFVRLIDTQNSRPGLLRYRDPSHAHAPPPQQGWRHDSFKPFTVTSHCARGGDGSERGTFDVTVASDWHLVLLASWMYRFRNWILRPDPLGCLDFALPRLAALLLCQLTHFEQCECSRNFYRGCSLWGCCALQNIENKKHKRLFQEITYVTVNLTINKNL